MKIQSTPKRLFLFTIIALAFAIDILTPHTGVGKTATPKSETVISKTIKTSDLSETHLGSLKFFDGMPDENTAQMAYGNLGFGKYYGFFGGDTDQWAPLIYDGVKKIKPPRKGKDHFTEDITNQAVNWVNAQKSMMPDKPFFVYFSTGR